MGKSKRQLADEAYRRVMDQVAMPLDEPQQVSTVQRHEAVPETCPGCAKRMTLASGWALVFGDLLQCGGCGLRIEVPRTAYERFAIALHEHFARLAARRAPLPKREKRARGAE